MVSKDNVCSHFHSLTSMADRGAPFSNFIGDFFNARPALLCDKIDSQNCGVCCHGRIPVE